VSRSRWKDGLLHASAAMQHRVPAAAPLLLKVEKVASNFGKLAALDLPKLSERIELAIALAEPAVESVLPPNSRTVAHRAAPAAAAPRGVICSLATGTHVHLLSIAAPTLVAFGERHGWDVVLSTEEDLCQGRPAPWGKIPLIKQLLDEYELVWWIDADAIIVDTTKDIRDELDDDKDLFLVEHLFAWPHQHAANTGMMVWRSTDWSRALLDETWAMEKYTYHYAWENVALIELLGYSIWPFFHREPTKWMERVKLLGVEWNSVWPDPSPSPRINHHGGNISVERRRTLMLGDLARFRRGEPAQMGPPPAPLALPGPARTYLTSLRPASTMSRADLPALLNERGLLGCGAEIGVYAAEFSSRLLSEWRGRNLISIDPWSPADADEYVDASNLDEAGFSALYATARTRLQRFAERSTIWRTTSAEAAERLPAGCLDFVYIDARHDERSVRQDLELWLPKVRPGGIIAGHDYVDGELPEGRFGVKTAVDAFFGVRRLRVHVTGEETFPSWIVELDREPT
jgi:hypothetical protein